MLQQASGCTQILLSIYGYPVQGYPQLAGPNYDYYAYIYGQALKLYQRSARTYTIFLPCDEYFVKNNIRRNNYLDMVKAKPYAYNGPMIAALVPDRQLSPSFDAIW